MAEYEERLGKDLPQKHILELKDRTAREIDDFTVSFVLDNELCGSGTLIDAFGTLGILTAFHVAEEIERDPRRWLGLIIARHEHRFELPRISFEHAPLGEPSVDRPEDGPDLSFFRLSGESQLATIKSKKSFYRIGGKSFEDFRDLPLEKVFWWVAGAPAALAKPMTSTSREGALVAKHFVGQATYKRIIPGDPFDKVILDIDADVSPFAPSYKGCSGGGVWLSPLNMDPDKGDASLDIDPCRLAGVSYFEGDLVEGTREIIANGPKSLETLNRFRDRLEP